MLAGYLRTGHEITRDQILSPFSARNYQGINEVDALLTLVQSLLNLRGPGDHRDIFPGEVQRVLRGHLSSRQIYSYTRSGKVEPLSQMYCLSN